MAGRCYSDYRGQSQLPSAVYVSSISGSSTATIRMWSLCLTATAVTLRPRTRHTSGEQGPFSISELRSSLSSLLGQAKISAPSLQCFLSTFKLPAWPSSELELTNCLGGNMLTVKQWSWDNCQATTLLYLVTMSIISQADDITMEVI